MQIMRILFTQFFLGIILGVIFFSSLIWFKSPTNALIAYGAMHNPYATHDLLDYDIVTRKNSTKILCIVRCSSKKTAIEEQEVQYYYCHPGMNAIADTWAKRCDSTIFLVPFEEYSKVNLPPNGIILHFTSWETDLNPLLYGLKYAYDHYFDKFDWIFKADDNAFVVIENLKNLLAQYDTTEPLLIGEQSAHYATADERSGSTSYAISKGALKRFMLKAVLNPFCSMSALPEEIALNICFSSVGIEIVGNRDGLGRKRFYPGLYRRLTGFYLRLRYEPQPYELKQKYYYEIDSTSNSLISFGLANDGRQHSVANAFIYELSPNNH